MPAPTIATLTATLRGTRSASAAPCRARRAARSRVRARRDAPGRARPSWSAHPAKANRDGWRVAQLDREDEAQLRRGEPGDSRADDSDDHGTPRKRTGVVGAVA